MVARTHNQLPRDSADWSESPSRRIRQNGMEESARRFGIGNERVARTTDLHALHAEERARLLELALLERQPAAHLAPHRERAADAAAAAADEEHEEDGAEGAAERHPLPEERRLAVQHLAAVTQGTQVTHHSDLGLERRLAV